MTEPIDTFEQTAVVGDRFSSPEVYSDSYEISLIEVLKQLAYRKQLIAKVTGIAALTALVLCFVLPVEFTATTKIMSPQQTQSTASMMMSQLAGLGGGSFATLAGSGLGLKNPNDVYIGLLTSRTVADAIIQKFGLDKVYRTSNLTKARKKLASHTEVTSEKSGFIAISVTDRDKKRAAAMANAYTEELRILTQSLAVTEASQRRLFYEEQLKQSKDALVAAAMAFQQVQQRKGLVQYDAQAKVMVEGLAALRAQVTAKQVQLQALRSYSTEKNPEVQLAEKELASLEAEEAGMEQRNRAPGVAGMGLENMPSAGLEYLRAEHELQYQQALYDILMKQYDAARLDESKDAAIIQVVEPAVEPDMKSSPPRALIALGFVFFGFFAGCFLALFLWGRELAQSDPVKAKQLVELSQAFKGLKGTRF